MVTKISNTVLECRKTGRNYYTIPGVSDLIDHKPETLEECLARLWDIPVEGLKDKHRKKEKALAKHMYRAYLSIQLAMKDEETAERCNCSRCMVVCSRKSHHNLVETDKYYRDKWDYILEKEMKKLLIITR